MNTKTAVIDVDVRPYLLEELTFRNYLVGSSQKRDQNVKRASSDINRFEVLFEDAGHRIKLKRTKTDRSIRRVLGRAGHLGERSFVRLAVAGVKRILATAAPKLTSGFPFGCLEWPVDDEYVGPFDELFENLLGTR